MAGSRKRWRGETRRHAASLSRRLTNPLVQFFECGLNVFPNAPRMISNDNLFPSIYLLMIGSESPSSLSGTDVFG
jgi:hypothetical protein